MTHFIRGKQVGVQNDLSAGLAPELFAIDNVAQYGVNSQISAIAYDPVQSLMAIGTSESKFGSGKIYVFGRDRVCVTFSPERASSVKIIQFCADRLLSIDSKSYLCIFSLSARKMETSYSPPGRITAMMSDPTLDYVFIGLQSGDIIAYDLDRQQLAQLRIPSLWQVYSPRSKINQVVAIELHPRDIGTMLIAYTEGVAIYSFKQNKALTYLHYVLQPGAPGGYSDPMSSSTIRYPRVVHAIWHPTGTFILTGHEDESLVFWDPKQGKIITARTLQDFNVHQVGHISNAYGSTPGTFAMKSPLARIAWCSKGNPDDTGILVAGGAPSNVPGKTLTFFELGQTPVYQTSSWQILSSHFEKPRGTRSLPLPPNTDVVDFCLIPRSSPHYAGSHDPIAIIVLLSSGEMATLSFPSGHHISATNQLHPSLTFIHPFATKFALTRVGRTRWLGMSEKRAQGPRILQGGAESTRPLMRFEDRNVIQVAHMDGTIRIWDAGHGDDIENKGMIQVDLSRALVRTEALEVLQMSFSGAAAEFAAGLATGEVVIFRWDRNKFFGQELDSAVVEAFGLEDIRKRSDPDLKEGLLPLTMLASQTSPVSALCISDIGFVAAGFRDGAIVVIDLRGPAVIFDSKVSDYRARSRQSGSVRLKGGQATTINECPSTIEYGIMSLEGQGFSSILLFVGTNKGRLLTFQILPEVSGGYKVSLGPMSEIENRIISICPLNAETGQPAWATQNAMSKLSEGHSVNGAVVVVSTTEVKILRLGSSKAASKKWNDSFCHAATIARRDDRSSALVALFGDGAAKTYSLPNLKEVASSRVDDLLDVQKLPDAVITPTSDIFSWTGPSEIKAINVWGSGVDLSSIKDKLTGPNISIPPRPTISNMQWISGTQYFTPSDFDLLVGGPDRPLSKHTVDAEASVGSAPDRSMSSTSSRPSQQEEGYWAYMQRQVQERTDKLNIMGDSMDRLEESSSNWVDDVNKYVSNQKKKAVMGAIGSKFGF